METNNLNNQLLDFEQGVMKFTRSLNIDNDERNLVRETLHNAVMKRSKYKINGNLHDWTDTMTRKTFVNNYKRIVRMTPSDSNVNDLFWISHSKTDPDNETFTNIIRNIERLNFRLKKPFKLYLEGNTYKEIAHSLNLKIETVTKRILIARSQLMFHETSTSRA